LYVEVTYYGRGKGGGYAAMAMEKARVDTADTVDIVDMEGSGYDSGYGAYDSGWWVPPDVFDSGYGEYDEVDMSTAIRRMMAVTTLQ
jgi:hypothetical protein